VAQTCENDRYRAMRTKSAEPAGDDQAPRLERECGQAVKRTARCPVNNSQLLHYDCTPAERAYRSRQASSKVPVAISHRTGWTASVLAGPRRAPRQSCDYVRSVRVVASTITGCFMWQKSTSAHISHATQTTVCPTSCRHVDRAAQVVEISPVSVASARPRPRH
jgi:hypothetical protein